MRDAADGRGDIPSIDVILDACILFPGSLRDVLLRAAEEELYRLYLTDQILEEVRKNLVGKKQVTEERGLYIVNRMKERFRSSFVTDHTRLIPAMPINEKDRHVLVCHTFSNQASCHLWKQAHASSSASATFWNMKSVCMKGNVRH